MNVDRRTLLGAVAAGSVTLGGCMGADINDVFVVSRVDDVVEFTLALEFRNGDVVTESASIQPDGDWAWNGFDGRRPDHVRVQTSGGLSEEYEWQGGAGLSVTIRPDTIDIRKKSA